MVGRKYLYYSLVVMMVVASVVAPPAPSDAQGEARTFFVSEDGVFSLWLPSGWSGAGDEGSGLKLTNNAALLQDELERSELVADEVFITVTIFPDLFYTALELELSATPDMIVDELKDFLGENEEALFGDLGRTDVVTITQRELALSSGESDLGDVGVMAFPLFQGDNALVFVGTASGAWDDHETTVIEMLDSLRYSPPLRRNFRPSRNTPDISFSYPNGWAVNVGTTAIVVSNQEGVTAETPLSVGIFRFTLEVVPMTTQTWEGVTWELPAIQVPQGLTAIPDIPLSYEEQSLGAIVFVDAIGQPQGGVFWRWLEVDDDETPQAVVVRYESVVNSYQLTWLAANIALSIE